MFTDKTCTAGIDYHKKSVFYMVGSVPVAQKKKRLKIYTLSKNKGQSEQKRKPIQSKNCSTFVITTRPIKQTKPQETSGKGCGYCKNYGETRRGKIKLRLSEKTGVQAEKEKKTAMGTHRSICIGGLKTHVDVTHDLPAHAWCPHSRCDSSSISPVAT